MFAREEGVIVRFIEFMPLEEERVWSPDTVVSLDEIVTRMSEYRPLVEIPRGRSETARRYRFDDGVGGSASLLLSRIRSAATAAAFELPQTERSGPVFFRSGTTIFTGACRAALRMRNSPELTRRFSSSEAPPRTRP